MSDAGRYRLQQRIGSGGMAEVLDAVAVGEQGFERRVAIKRMHPGGGASRERMFLDEARIAAQLHHANIVAVLDYGVVDGQPFQVLEHVDGLDVGALLVRAGPLPPEVALYICAMVGHALDHAHAACDAAGQPLGIVHRDVTPGNVLVAWTGDVRLTDFGIAFANQRLERTLAGNTKGTPLYMAPEQMIAGEIDRRTDLFALGCVLHAMVTGQSPVAQEAQLLRLSQGGELELDPALPADIRAIVARATRYARHDRYRDAAELGAATAQALAARGGDPRAALRAWLHRLRPATAPVRGKLDALLDGELVLATTAGGVRRFASTLHAARSPEAATLVDAPAAARAAVAVDAPRSGSRAPHPAPVAAPVPHGSAPLDAPRSEVATGGKSAPIVGSAGSRAAPRAASPVDAPGSRAPHAVRVPVGAPQPPPHASGSPRRPRWPYLLSAMLAIVAVAGITIVATRSTGRLDTAGAPGPIDAAGAPGPIAAAGAPGPIDAAGAPGPIDAAGAPGPIDAAGSNSRPGAIDAGANSRPGAIDAGASSRPGAIDAGASSRPGAIDAGASEPPAGQPSPEADAIDRWATRHKPASRALGDWVRAHPATAAALFDWGEHHALAAVSLVAWAHDNPSATLDSFAASRPRIELAPLVAAHAADLAGFVAWMRAFPAAADALMHHSRGLAWVGKQLATP